MDEKKGHPQESTPNNSHLHDTSNGAQRRRSLKRLQQGPVDTLTLRRELCVLMPAARIKELRDLGYNISTTRVSLADEQGVWHKGVALYTLHANPVEVAA